MMLHGSADPRADALAYCTVMRTLIDRIKRDGRLEDAL